MSTIAVPDGGMVCYQCGKRIYRKPGVAVVHLFWNRRPGASSVEPAVCEPGWAHAACAEQAGVHGLQRHYQYPWGREAKA